LGVGEVSERIYKYSPKALRMPYYLIIILIFYRIGFKIEITKKKKVGFIYS